MNDTTVTKGAIVFVMHPEYSGFNATLRLAKELKHLGYRVIYAVVMKAPENFESYICKQGFEFKTLKPDDDFDKSMQEEQKKAAEQFRQMGIVGRMRQQRKRRKEIHQKLTHHLMETTGKWLKDISAELILLHKGAMFSAFLFMTAGIPVVGLSTNLSGYFSHHIPPVFSGMIPANTKLSRLRVGWAWKRLFFKNRLAFAGMKLMDGIGFSSLITRSLVTHKKRIESYGGQVQQGEFIVPVLKVPELMLCPYEFDFPGAVESEFRCYGGSGVDTNREEDDFDWSWKDEERKLIFCSIGSHQPSFRYRERFFQQVIAAVEKRPQYQLLLHVSDEQVRKRLELSHPSVLIREWVPQLKVLSKAALFLTHGGLGSIRESLYYGVPMIVFPQVNDGFGNAARVEYHRLGVRCMMNKATAESIGLLMDKVMADEQVAKSVSQMQQVFADQEDFKKGIAFIQKNIETHK